MWGSEYRQSEYRKHSQTKIFEAHILPDLKSNHVNPIVKVGVIKYIMIFRSHVKINNTNSEGSYSKRFPITLNGISLHAETINIEAITGIGMKVKPGNNTK